MASNPFFTNGAVSERRYFVGRGEELRAIFARAFGDAPQSVNLTGEARSGKSSLLRHVQQTYEDVAPDAKAVVAVYVEFGRVNADSEASFYGAIAEALLAEIPRKRGLLQYFQRGELEAVLKMEPFERAEFDKAMRAWKKAGILPMLCLDRFEYLLDKPEVFPDGFYEVLRALADDGVVMLAIASRKTVAEYGKTTPQYTSGFFNLFHTLRVGGLAESAAWDLVRLPVGAPALSVTSQALARKWGGCDAFRLQAAGWCLFEMERDGLSEAVARKNFEERTKRRPKGVRDWKNWFFVAWSALRGTGRSAQATGKNIKPISEALMGAIVIALVLSIGLGWLGVGKFPKVFEDFLKLFRSESVPEQQQKRDHQR